MKHYVMGFVFNKARDKVLLIKKKRPEWQAGHWNGVGGKVEQDDRNFSIAMYRETYEEIGYVYKWEHCVTFVCPGGTVFVFKAFSETICFVQKEDEQLKVWSLNELPENMMANLKWIIPVCLSTIQFPLLVFDTTLGVKASGAE